MAEKISVAVVDNKVDNLTKSLEDYKRDNRRQQKEDKADILEAIENVRGDMRDNYVKKTEVVLIKYVVGAIGTVVTAMVIFVLQQLVQGRILK